jgi:hypothetical protein
MTPLEQAREALQEAECALDLMQSYGHCDGDRAYGRDVAQVRAVAAALQVKAALAALSKEPQALPPLPKPTVSLFVDDTPFFSADQMRAYAEQTRALTNERNER